MEKQKFKATLFDLDGTLLDTLGSIRMYLNEVLAEIAVKGITDDETRAFVGDGARVLVERALLNDDKRGRELLREGYLARLTAVYVKRYNDNPYPKTVLYSGIDKALCALRQQGIRLAVISNKPDKTVKQLVSHFFPGVFDEVYGQRDAVPLKPSPEAPLEICRLLGVAPSETAYFGDTGVDVKTASAYGAGLNVGVAWGFREREELALAGADVIISHPNEIPSLLLD